MEAKNHFSELVTYDINLKERVKELGFFSTFSG